MDVPPPFASLYVDNVSKEVSGREPVLVQHFQASLHVSAALPAHEEEGEEEREQFLALATVATQPVTHS